MLGRRRGGIPVKKYVTSGLVLDFNANNINGLGKVGTNSPLTTTVKNLVDGSNLTLNNFGGTTSSGYVGSGSSADPFCVAFDGVDDYILTPRIINTIPFSILTWVYASSFGGENEIFTQFIGGDSGRLITGQFFNKFTLFIGGNRLNSITTSLTNRLYYLAFTRDDVGLCKIYINGILDNSVNLNTNAIANTQGRIGNVSLGNFWNGKIANTLIYNRALTQDEITQNYNAGLSYN